MRKKMSLSLSFLLLIANSNLIADNYKIRLDGKGNDIQVNNPPLKQRAS